MATDQISPLLADLHLLTVLASTRSFTEAARRLGVSRVQLSRVLNGHCAGSADMAIRIGLLTRTTPESWLTGQVKWDVWQVLQKPAPRVEPLDHFQATT